MRRRLRRPAKGPTWLSLEVEEACSRCSEKAPARRGKHKAAFCIHGPLITRCGVTIRYLIEDLERLAWLRSLSPSIVHTCHEEHGTDVDFENL